jgi:hypothetical protein
MINTGVTHLYSKQWTLCGKIVEYMKSKVMFESISLHLKSMLPQ